MSSVFEAIMLLCFAASWPFSILKALRTKVVAGKSPAFMGIIEAGYVAGILFKLTAPGPTDPTVWLYVLNLAIVGTDLSLYFRYRNNVPSPAPDPADSGSRSEDVPPGDRAQRT